MDNNKLYSLKNGTFQNSGAPTSGSTGTGAISITGGVDYFMQEVIMVVDRVLILDGILGKTLLFQME